MIKILLCCEGTTDQGGKIYTDGEYINTDGVIQIFIRKIAKNEELVFVVKTRHDIKNAVKLRKRFYGKQETTSLKLVALAKQENCTHIAYHRDEDANGFEAMYQQVQEYFAEPEKNNQKCLAIVPMHMTESWLLSDKDAYPSEPRRPALPSKPEEIWGSKEADSHPKKYLKRVLEQFYQAPSLKFMLTLLKIQLLKW
jgi:hypothetical protein